MDLEKQDRQFLEYVRQKKREGMTEAEIARSLGLDTSKFRKIRGGCLRRKKEAQG